MSGIVARLCEEVPGPNGTVVLKPITTSCWLTPMQAAGVLGISRDMVYLLVEQGRLPASRFGCRTIRIEASDLMEFMRERAADGDENRG